MLFFLSSGIPSAKLPTNCRCYDLLRPCSSCSLTMCSVQNADFCGNIGYLGTTHETQTRSSPKGRPLQPFQEGASFSRRSPKSYFGSEYPWRLLAALNLARSYQLGNSHSVRVPRLWSSILATPVTSKFSEMFKNHLTKFSRTSGLPPI